MANATVDRRLRAISDAIDTKNYKQALKLVNAFLQKTPPAAVPIGKVLKAMILEKSGKPEEAIQLCDEIKKANPPVVDETALSTLYLVYRSLDRLSDATLCYENASKAAPQNEDLAQAVFWSHVREFNYQKQQQTAMKLFKDFPKDKYLFWSIISTYLQVPREATQHTLLTLTERMAQKYITEKNASSEEVLFFLSILERQKKFKEALEALESKKAVFKLDEEFLSLKANYQLKSGNTEEATASYKNLIQNVNSGEFSYYQLYRDLALSDKPTEERVNEVLSFFEEISKNNATKREPFLAITFVEAKLVQESLPKADITRFADSFVNYVTRFGKKSCCLHDLKPVLELAKTKKDYILEKIKANEPSDETDFLDVTTRKITFAKLRRAFGCFASLSFEEAKQSANEFVEAYQKSHEHKLNLEETENHPGDDYLILATNILIHCFATHPKKSIQPLLDAAVLLEHAILSSKYNYQLKLALISVYNAIGAYQPAHDIFSTLDIKHIQLDTLSYLVLDSAIRSCRFAEAISTTQTIEKFHTDSRRELPELATYPYRHGGYTKVKEFIDFKDRLAHSHQLAIARTEAVLIELIKYQNPILALGVIKNALSQLTASDEERSKLIENQDYTVLERWDDFDTLNGHEFSSSATYFNWSFAEQLQLLKLRTTTIQLLQTSLSPKADGLKELLSEYRKIATALKLFKEGDDLSEEQIHYAIRNEIIEATLALNEFLSNNHDETTNAVKSKFEAVKNLFIASNKNIAIANAEGSLNNFILPQLSSLVQVISFYRVIAAHWDSQIPTNRKKKKGDDESLLARIMEVRAKLKELDIAVTEIRKGFEKVIKPIGLKVGSGESVLTHFNEQKGIVTKVQNAIEASYKESLNAFLKSLE